MANFEQLIKKWFGLSHLDKLWDKLTKVQNMMAVDLVIGDMQGEPQNQNSASIQSSTTKINDGGISKLAETEMQEQDESGGDITGEAEIPF